MRRIKYWQVLVMVIGINGWIEYACAADYGAMLNVPAGTTITTTIYDVVNSFAIAGAVNGSEKGVLNNGSTIVWGEGQMGGFDGGVLNNFGNIVATNYVGFTIQGTVANKPHASITLANWGYIDMYSNGAYFSNEGTISVVSDGNFTAGVLRGQFFNTGRIFMDVPQSNGVNSYVRNICENGSSIFKFENRGVLEIAADTVCDFANEPATVRNGKQFNKTTFQQSTGKTVVNGILGAHEFRFNGGLISGKGTVRGDFFENRVPSTLTFELDDLLGAALTLQPPSNQLTCDGCAVNFNINGDFPPSLHVVGHLNLNAWKLSIRLSPANYIPDPGARFELITATNGISELDTQHRVLSLPQMPNGRTWSVVNEGNQIVLIAN